MIVAMIEMMIFNHDNKFKNQVKVTSRIPSKLRRSNINGIFLLITAAMPFTVVVIILYRV